MLKDCEAAVFSREVWWHVDVSVTLMTLRSHQIMYVSVLGRVYAEICVKVTVEKNLLEITI